MPRTQQSSTPLLLQRKMDDFPDPVRRIQANHPECTVNKNISSQCRSIDGELSCDERSTFFLMCPGKAPVSTSFQATCMVDFGGHRKRFILSRNRPADQPEVRLICRIKLNKLHSMCSCVRLRHARRRNNRGALQRGWKSNAKLFARVRSRILLLCVDHQLITHRAERAFGSLGGLFGGLDDEEGGNSPGRRFPRRNPFCRPEDDSRDRSKPSPPPADPGSTYV